MAGKPKDPVERFGAQWDLTAMSQVTGDLIDATNGVKLNEVPGNSVVHRSMVDVSVAATASQALTLKLVDPEGVESDIALAATVASDGAVTGLVNVAAETAVKTVVPMDLILDTAGALTDGVVAAGVSYTTVGRQNEVTN